MYCTQPIETTLELFTRAAEKLPPLADVPSMLASPIMSGATSLKNRVTAITKAVAPFLVSFTIIGIATAMLAGSAILLGSSIVPAVVLSLTVVILMIIAMDTVRHHI